MKSWNFVCFIPGFYSFKHISYKMNTYGVDGKHLVKLSYDCDVSMMDDIET